MHKLILFFMLIFLFAPQVSAKLENGMDASVVLGQQDFNSLAAGLSDQLLNQPINVFTDGTRLLSAEQGNRRVLIWNEIPTQNTEPADIVIGQPDFTTNTVNTGGLSASSMNVPTGLWTDGQKLIVSDILNHRILIWNSFPTSNFQRADVVLGQQAFNTNGSGTSRQLLNRPDIVCVVDGKLMVTEQNNHRILIWNTIPSSSFAPADTVLGQPNFTTGTSGISNKKFNVPRWLFSDGNKLYLSENNNNRVLIWNEIPKENFVPADLVLGQPNFTSRNLGTSAQQIISPRGVISLGGLFLVADRNNHRVLIWKRVPAKNFIAADIVLGQSNFSSGTTGVGKNRMGGPHGIASDGTRLIVAELDNNRILIYDLVDSGLVTLGPQFSQGKAVVGKVFWDFDGDGRQN